MNKAFFLQLVFNASLLLTLALIYDLVAGNWRSRRTLLQQVPVGVVIGCVGVIIMLASWKLEPGIIFDTRSILLGVSGLFFGTVPTVVAMAITAVYRGFMGGAAVWMGIAVIFTSGAIGIAWRYWRRSFLADITWRELYLFGLVIHLGMLGCTLILPSVTRWQVLANIVLPVLLIYPIVTAFLGKLLADHLKRERTKQQLRESEGRYQNLAKIAPVGIFHTDENGATTYVNPMWCQISGLSEAKAMGAGWLGAVNPDDRESLSKGWQETINLQKPSFADYRFLRPDGTIAWVMGQATPEMNSENEIVGYVGTITDISERKQAEQELHKSEAQYRAFFNTSRDCVFITSLTGRWLHMNDVAVELFGYPSREELSQVNISNLYANPEERAKHIGIIMERGYSKEFPVDLRRKDGVVIHALITAVPHYDADGNVTGFQGTIRDITERKRAEEMLRESEKKYRNLTESLDELIYRADPETFMTTHVNRAVEGIYGYTAEEWLGDATLWESTIYPDDKERVFAWFTEAQRKMESGGIEYRIIRKDETVRWVDDHANWEKDQQGNVVSLNGVLYDITERKRAEEKLKNSLMEKEVLLKEVHHRVKNNLMTIIGLIKMQGTKADNEMFNPLLQELEGRVRAMALVHESLHKAEDLAYVDLQNYIETMSAHIRAQFGVERDIRFSVQAAGVEVNLDIAVPCGLILNELITNAYKHAFPKGKPRSRAGKCEIAVTMKREDGALTLTVADNGVGLPAGKNWKNPETLGLRLVKMLSQQLNGSMELDRSAGTTFSLRFAHSSGGK